MEKKNIIVVATNQKRMMKTFKKSIEHRYSITWYNYTHLASWILEQGLGYEMGEKESKLVNIVSEALDSYDDLCVKDLRQTICEFNEGIYNTDYLIIEVPTKNVTNNIIGRFRYDKDNKRFGFDNIITLKLEFAEGKMSGFNETNALYDYTLFNNDNEVTMGAKMKKFFSLIGGN